ncbi:MAG: DUF4097 domain-containing protein [Planctomycetes bacterium]|nr:DUF4097 domain-containing protein [Planctomycetota bacterium]
MIAFMDDFSSLEKIFAFCAMVGGVLFMARMVLLFIGGDTDIDIDGDVDTDFNSDTASDTDMSFRFISFQGLTAFFMMFGLVGLALKHQHQWSDSFAVTGGVAAGALTCWMLKWLFDKAKGLQSSGNIDLNNAIGQEGTVYLTIPASGTGQTQVNVQNHLKIFDAISDGDIEIKTGEAIKVIKIVSGNVLVVEKLLDNPVKDKTSS